LKIRKIKKERFFNTSIPVYGFNFDAVALSSRMFLELETKKLEPYIMNEITKKIHTTELGKVRIKKNLELETDDVVKWCKNKVKNADNIIRKGKNWYVYKDDVIITINANSYTIITAHKKKKKLFVEK